MRRYYAIYKITNEPIVGKPFNSDEHQFTLADTKLYLKLDDAERALNMLPTAQYTILPFYQPYTSK